MNLCQDCAKKANIEKFNPDSVVDGGCERCGALGLAYRTDEDDDIPDEAQTHTPNLRFQPPAPASVAPVPAAPVPQRPAVEQPMLQRPPTMPHQIETPMPAETAPQYIDVVLCPGAAPYALERELSPVEEQALLAGNVMLVQIPIGSGVRIFIDGNWRTVNPGLPTS